MLKFENDPEIQGKIKKLFKIFPEYKVSDERRRRYIADIFSVREEKKRLVTFMPLGAVRVMAYAAAAVTIFFVFSGYNYLFAPQYPELANIKGTVKVYRHASNEWIMAEGGRIRLSRNDIVKTFGDGEADMSIPHVYSVRLKRDSEMTIASIPCRAIKSTTQFDMAKGRVFVHYDKSYSGGRKPFNIETPQAVATCLGTDFMVDSIPLAGRTWVGVLTGLVNVESREKIGQGTGVLVRPGEKTIVNQGEAPTRPERLFENELIDLGELYGLGNKEQVALMISAGPTRTRELLSVVPLYISSEAGTSLPGKIERIAMRFSRAIREGSDTMHLENIQEFEEIVRSRPNPKYDVQLLLFIAAYYEYLDQHEKAIETFRKVLEDYPDSSLASIAQCAIGIIYEEKLNDAEKAADAYRKVLSLYPTSPEAEEASAGLKRLIN